MSRPGVAAQRRKEKTTERDKRVKKEWVKKKPERKREGEREKKKEREGINVSQLGMKRKRKRERKKKVDRGQKKKRINHLGLVLVTEQDRWKRRKGRKKWRQKIVSARDPMCVCVYFFFFFAVPPTLTARSTLNQHDRPQKKIRIPKQIRTQRVYKNTCFCFLLLFFNNTFQNFFSKPPTFKNWLISIL